MQKLSRPASRSSIGLKKRQGKSGTLSNISVTEDAFTHLFKKMCAEFHTNVAPVVQIVSCEPPVGSFFDVRSSRNPSKYSLKRSIKKEPANRLLLIYAPGDPDDILESAIFMRFPVDATVLKSFRRTLHSFQTLSTLKLEFCSLTNIAMRSLKRILIEIPTIIELSVRGNPNPYQNFYILLKETNLHHFNASLCQINNRGANLIAQQLAAHSPQTLISLNLSSNFIENDGVQCIANALRVNRTILALNLADNWMDDDGCKAIMRVMQKFELKHEEIVLRRGRRFEMKRKLLKLNQEKLSVISFESKRGSSSIKSASARSTMSLKRTKRRSSAESRRSNSKSRSPKGSKTSNSLTSDELSAIQNSLSIEIDEHPFVVDSYPEDMKIYCKGNFHLAHLNLSYNKIHLGGIQAILQMLMYQKSPEMESHGGLMNLNIEGICICYDVTLSHINALLYGSPSKRSSLSGNEDSFLRRTKSGRPIY